MDRCTHTSPLIDIQPKENENFFILPDSSHCLMANKKRDITFVSYVCIAPVGGHTCITAGERSEPAD